MQEIQITAKDAGQRLDKYLKKYLPEAGSGFLYKMLRKKNITLNGKKAEGNENIKERDVIRIFFSEETLAKMRGRAFSGNGASEETGAAALDPRRERALKAYRSLAGIGIVYEDEDLLFVNKPAGIFSQEDDNGALSLNDWIYGYSMQNKTPEEAAFVPAVCNRLDRNTSGLVLCGKTYAGSRFLSDMIRGHGLRKIYRAVAEGKMTGEGRLQGYWSKDSSKNIVCITPKALHPQDPQVETKYRVLRYREKDDCTLTEVELITGKSHQIRAHFASIGHPLAGDLKYGGHPRKGTRSQLLHAYAVQFPAIGGAFSRISGKRFCAVVSWLEEWE